MQQHGWTLLFHDNLIERLTKLRAAVLRAQQSDPVGFESSANVKFFRALVQLMRDGVPGDPARDEYRQGNTMGPAWRHWRRAGFSQRHPDLPRAQQQRVIGGYPASAAGHARLAVATKPTHMSFGHDRSSKPPAMLVLTMLPRMKMTTAVVRPSG
ncbi:MAG: type II toxin-antitoxin system YhaV family toxin [Burkholderiaceae bacterium]